MYNNLLFDKAFKQKFKEVSLLNKDATINKLLTLFDMPPYYFCRAAMHQFYTKFPEISFDKNVASKILLDYFANGFFSIPDYDVLFYADEENEDDDNLTETTREDLVMIGEKSALNWLGFFQKIQDIYWLDSKNNEVLEAFNFFEDRQPKNAREKFLASGNAIRVNGKPLTAKYLFFNVKEVLKYYEKLFSIYYPEYPFNTKASAKSIKRYAKKIENGLYVGIFVNYALLESELKMGYLELPGLQVEIFSDALVTPVKENTYLSGEVDCPIARIDLFYFMGHFADNRVGNASNSSELLQKRFHFYFEVQSYYMKIYLEAVEHILSQCGWPAKASPGME